MGMFLTAAALALSAASSEPQDPASGRQWLAGDHHVHSRFSATYSPDPVRPEAPPTPVLGGDGNNTIVRNAKMAHRFGLSWMVSTDHGGPLHAQLNADQAYPELLQARTEVPGLILFYGMEFDVPGAEHASLIIPPSANERDALFQLESRFGRREPWPADPVRDTEGLMLDAIAEMATMDPRPLIVVNHPSRSASALGVYGQVRPEQLRDWSDRAPGVVIGMEGAPGHQADGLFADGRTDPTGSRGIYRRHPTLGGFDQMTARLGGVWDSLLGEGRRWWITATSDSHTNIAEGGDDFWPGEYSKTFVYARPDAADVLDGLRQGRIFVVTGNLITALDVTAETGGASATMGETLVVPAGEATTITIRIHVSDTPNANGQTPRPRRVDLIVGEVGGPVADRASDTNTTARVAYRFGPSDWREHDGTLVMSHELEPSAKPRYVRVRGTGGVELEPSADMPGEDPWSDLWFYGNPIFLTAPSSASGRD